MESRSKKLRSGYTTGACAAAAAKAAAMLLLKTAADVKASGRQNAKDFDTMTHCHSDTIEIPLPTGDRVTFNVHRSTFRVEDSRCIASASVIKDAGDDPDVTNGAEIVAEAAFHTECGMRISNTLPLVPSPQGRGTFFNILSPGGRGLRRGGRTQLLSGSEILKPKSEIIIKGGTGVGRVTKPGLSVPVGEPAINPVPRRMILEAVNEAIADCGLQIAEFPNPKSEIGNPQLVITISVPKGEELARKTLNARLGIMGGISILGTTGIVRPLSTAAWTASITSSMDVARAMGCGEVVISAGRTSERAHMKRFHLPEEAYVMMGDYLEFSLSDAKKHGFGKIHLCAQWAKMLKIAMSTPQTHVRHGAIDVGKAVELLNSLGIPVPRERDFNTAREIYDFLNSSLSTHHSSLFLKVCGAARGYAEGIARTPVAVHLVSYEGDIIAGNE